MGFKSIEDIIAWQRARKLAGEIYKATCDIRFERDPWLRTAMRRCSSSIMVNIAEGFERETPRDFSNFLRIAAGSTGELKSYIHYCSDVGLLTADAAARALADTSEVARVVHGLRNSITRTEHCGLRTEH